MNEEGGTQRFGGFEQKKEEAWQNGLGEKEPVSAEWREWRG